MLLHRYSNEIDLENVEITLQEAFELLEEQFTEKMEADSFIGFSHPNSAEAILQFVRHTETNWSIDIPVFSNDEFVYSLIGNIHHRVVFSIVTEFFNNSSIFQEYMLSLNYNQLIEYSKTRWGLILTPYYGE